jgi:hypothetical protein
MQHLPADSAQVIGNKLYLLGGGWEAVTVTVPFPVQHPCAIVASFKVPWLETNQKHTFEVEILTEDGASLFKMGGQAEVGRPPGIPAGEDQRVQLAVPLMLGLEKAGCYVLVARVNGEDKGKANFRVLQAA